MRWRNAGEDVVFTVVSFIIYELPVDQREIDISTGRPDEKMWVEERFSNEAAAL